MSVLHSLRSKERSTITGVVPCRAMVHDILVYAWAAWHQRASSEGRQKVPWTAHDVHGRNTDNARG